MEFTLIMGVWKVDIVPGKMSGSRRFYVGKTTRYYVHGAVQNRRDAAMGAMMSHAFKQGETLTTLSKWRDGK